LKIIGKLIGWIWALLFLSFVAATLYKNSGNELPGDIAQYHDLFQSWLEAFLSSWVFGVVFVFGWFVVSYLLGKESGWRKLAEVYAESDTASVPRFSTGSGRIGKVPYQGSLQVGAHPLGLALRVFLPFRFGSPNLNIPWSAVESVTIRKSASPPNNANFLDKFISKVSGALYAHITLSQFREQTIIVPWNEVLRDNLPSSLNPVVEDH
jgi:hypothetical protein